MSQTLTAERPKSGADEAARTEWVARVLGVTLPQTAPPSNGASLPSGKTIKVAPAPKLLDGHPKPRMGVNRTAGLRRAVKPDVRIQAPQTFEAGDGRKLEIRKGPDGRVALTAPPPPIAEITFSGGGGKGAALPGAVHALKDTLKGVGVIKGASVGSMSASLLAAGISPEDFEKAVNDPNTSSRILEGRIGGKSATIHGLAGKKISGTGLQSVVREQMSKAASKQIDAFLEKLQAQEDESAERAEEGSDGDLGTDTAAPGADPELLKEVKAIREKIKDPTKGLTFKDLRTLHKVIPDIKEVEISATMVGSDLVEEDGDKPAQGPGKGARLKSSLYKKLGIEETADGGEKPLKLGKPQLAMFTADTQPDMEVAVAAQASAALPPVFSPVDIELAGGFKGRFIDGGVLNNAPSTKTVQAERNVDPIPPSGGMTFIFEEDTDDDKEILAGRAKPVKKGMADKLTGAPHSAAEYGRARTLADSPEDLVVVPLKFDTGKKDFLGRKKTKDFSTLTGGTINFEISDKSKAKLQGLTKDATEEHVAKRKQPQTREFASDKQMLNCISRADLSVLAQQDYPGAKEELKFRDEALGYIDILVKEQSKDDDGAKSQQQDILLHQLEKIAGGDVDRQGFVGRELARSGRLDGLMKKGKTGDGAKLEVLDAGATVVAVIEAKAHAQVILREVIYPKMIEVKPKSSKGIVLKQVDDALRSARLPEDVNRGLEMAITTFGTSSKGEPKKSKFAEDCRRYLLQV